MNFIVLMSLSDFFKHYGLYVALLIVVVIFVVVLFLLIRNKKKDSNDNVTNDIVLALGGKENIINAQAKMSRLTIELRDISKVDNGKLKEIGIDKTITMSNKLTLLIGSKAIEIEKQINK